MPAPGDVWKIAAYLSNSATDPGECALITFWAQAVGMYFGPNDLANAFADSIGPVLTQLTNSVTCEGVFVSQFAPARGPQVPIPTPGLFGGSGSSGMPTGAAVEVLRKSVSPGRSNWGRVYLPWAPQGAIDGTFTNQVTNSYRVAIVSALNAYKTKMLGPNASGTSWLDGIYSYRSASVAPHFSPNAEWVANQDWRVAGRRGRRSADCLPFPASATPNFAIGTFGNGRGSIWGPAPSSDGRDLQTLTANSSSWTTYPTPPSGWTTPGTSFSGWDGVSCRSTLSILDNTTSASHGYGWDWPGGGGGSLVFPFNRAVPQYTNRDTSTHCGATGFPGGKFDILLFARDFDLPDSPIVSGALRCTYEMGLDVHVNGTLAYSDPGTLRIGPITATTIDVDVASLLVPNATNRLAFQQTSKNGDTLHNPCLWHLAPPFGPNYQDFVFAAVQLNVIQEPL